MEARSSFLLHNRWERLETLVIFGTVAVLGGRGIVGSSLTSSVVCFPWTNVYDGAGFAEAHCLTCLDVFHIPFSILNKR